jgi:hypothetical protein
VVQRGSTGISHDEPLAAIQAKASMKMYVFLSGSHAGAKFSLKFKNNIILHHEHVQMYHITYSQIVFYLRSLGCICSCQTRHYLTLYVWPGL